MVTTSKTLPLTPDSKPSSWVRQAIYSRKLRSSVFVWDFLCVWFVWWRFFIGVFFVVLVLFVFLFNMFM